MRKLASCLAPRWRSSTINLVLGFIILILLTASLSVAWTPFSNEKGGQGQGLPVTAHERQLKFTNAAPEPEAATREPPGGFVEVARAEPRVSFSTLDKLLAEERRVHGGGVAVGGGSLVAAVSSKDSKDNKDKVASLKSSLKDPAFVQKIGRLEDKRQELYLSLLTKRGQVVAGRGGGSTIVSYPKTPVKFPNNLKKNIQDWTEKEKLWLNITHFPWPDDPACSRYSVQFGSGLGVVGLASYPSSGNTWLRYLIEAVTGIYTGSMYNDVTIRKKGYYGEGVPADGGLVVAVKTHGHTTGEGMKVARPQQVEHNHHQEVNHTAILLIRNPFKAIIGHRNLDAGGHTGFAKDDQFQGPGWQSFVEIKAASWLHHYADWLQNNPLDNILVLHYENIQQNLKHSLRKISAFLGYKEDQGRMDCAIHYSTGYFKRNHKKDIQKSPYTPEQVAIIKSSINKLNEVLMKSQKETLPLDLYEYYEE